MVIFRLGKILPQEPPPFLHILSVMYTFQKLATLSIKYYYFPSIDCDMQLTEAEQLKFFRLCTRSQHPTYFVEKIVYM